MGENVKLAPCPFCGGEPHLMHCGAGTYMVQCLQCKATTDDGSLDRISANWNRRSALVDVPAVEPRNDNMVLTAVAAVLEADAEFRAQMPKGWDGDPLSDELDGLRRIFEGSPPLSHRGEDSADAFARIVAARKAYVDAVNTYNTRLSLVYRERANGNWSMRVDDEARAMWDAQSAFFKAAQDETDAALAATRSASANVAKGFAE